MSKSDNLVPVKQQPKFSVAITTSGYKNLINNTLGDPERAKRFIASITSAVAVNPALQDCEAGTILAGALLGESLNLSPSPQLGQYYLVPFKSKAKYDKKGNLISPEVTKAQFILGYKGYIQLAIRSGHYKKLNVLEIKEGELFSFDPLNEEIVCNLIEDYEEREAAETIGYYAMFEYINGFRKAMYWNKAKMMKHADTYSPAYSAAAHKKILAGEIPDKDLWKYSSFWYKNFDDMAKKTMLRQLISRWGIMSAELQQAFAQDSSLAEIGDRNEIVTTSEEQIQFTQPEATDMVEKVDLSEL
jgi:recombination protein RecT